jgi:hypothetical protein
VVNIPQKYPAEHATMTKDQAVEIVKKCFLPSGEASGAFQIWDQSYYWKDFDEGQMTADGFSFLAFHVKSENYVDAMFVGKDRYGDERYIKVPPGTPDSVKKSLNFEEIYTSEWRFRELKKVFILPITTSYARGGKPRGGYEVRLVWGNRFSLETRQVDIIVSKEDGARFLLAISKLAPQAQIRVENGLANDLSLMGYRGFSDAKQ